MDILKYIAICITLLSSNIDSHASNAKSNASTIEFQHDSDKRKIKSESSPLSLNAVGKLTHKRKRDKRNKVKLNCTASLIAPVTEMGSDIILTAKHCVSDDIITYKWITNNKDGKIERIAKVIYEDKENDWALLRLKEAVLYKDISPLLIDNSTFDNKNFKNEDPNDYIVAGFSVDWLGDYGKTLTYEDSPSYIDFSDNKNDGIGDVGAITHQGDSGGAIIYENDSVNYLVGIMSYIDSDKTLFKSANGTFGNLSGHFISLIKYESFYSVIATFF